MDLAFQTNPNLPTLFQASVEQFRVKQLGGLGERVLWVGGWFAGTSIRHELLLAAASSLDERRAKRKI